MRYLMSSLTCCIPTKLSFQNDTRNMHVNVKISLISNKYLIYRQYLENHYIFYHIQQRLNTLIKNDILTLQKCFLNFLFIKKC